MLQVDYLAFRERHSGSKRAGRRRKGATGQHKQGNQKDRSKDRRQQVIETEHL